MSTHTTEVLNQKVRLCLATPLPDGRLAISGSLLNGRAFPRVFIYDPVSQMIESDRSTLNCLLEECRKSGTNAALNVLHVVCDAAVWTIDIVIRIVTSILTSFVGFGLIGILLVVVMLLLAAYIWVMGLMVAAPFILVSFCLRIYKQKTLDSAAEQLTHAALQLIDEHLQIASTRGQIYALNDVNRSDEAIETKSTFIKPSAPETIVEDDDNLR